MQGHRRRRATQRSPTTPISPKGGGGTASISLSLLLHDVTDMAAAALRELDAVALATNVTVVMERDTKVPPTFRRCQRVKDVVAQLSRQLSATLVASNPIPSVAARRPGKGHRT